MRTLIYFTRLGTRVVATNVLDGLLLTCWLVYELDPDVDGYDITSATICEDIESASKHVNDLVTQAEALASALEAGEEGLL